MALAPQVGGAMFERVLGDVWRKVNGAFALCFGCDFHCVSLSFWAGVSWRLFFTFLQRTHINLF